MAKKAKRGPGRPATGQTPKRWLGRVNDEDWKTITEAGKPNFTKWALGILLRAARRKKNP